MNTVLYVGIDYHSKSLQVCVMNETGDPLINRSCANDWSAVVRAAQAKGATVHAAIEVGNGADALADELALHAGWDVKLGHPGYVRRMRQTQDKTDHCDAQLLANLVRVGYLPTVWQAPPQIRDLRRLIHYRHELAKQRRAIKQRIGGLLRNARVGRAPANCWTQRWLDWVRHEAALGQTAHWIVMQELEELQHTIQRIKAVEQQLTQLTRHDPLVMRLMALKGVGLITAVMLRAHIGRFDRFHCGKQLANFCGLSPRNASSGSRQATAGLIDGCDRSLRATLIQTAHGLMRYDERWGRFASKLLAAGKHKCLVVAAVANRWVRQLYHTMKPLGLGLPEAA